ncbi:MAG TPA: hypothetical protein VGG95_07455, partial [Edaphobacter sp.]
MRVKMQSPWRLLAAVMFVFVANPANGQTVAHPRLMDSPATPQCAVQSEWATPAEKSCYATTPDYAETIAYLKRVQETAPGQVK